MKVFVVHVVEYNLAEALMIVIVDKCLKSFEDLDFLGYDFGRGIDDCVCRGCGL